MKPTTTLLSLLFAAFPFTAAELHSPKNARHHQDLAKRAIGDISLHERSGHNKFTWFEVGLGACGKTNSPSEHVVAITHLQYSSSVCFKEITITIGSKSTTATIVDECMGCPYDGLDFSRGLFSFFSDLGAGEIYGSWTFGSGGGAVDEKTSSKYTPTSIHHHTPTSTSTHSTHSSSSTSTHDTPSTTSSSTISTTPTSTTSINYLTGDASGLAEPTGLAGLGSSGNLDLFNQAFIDLAGLVVAGADSK